MVKPAYVTSTSTEMEREFGEIIDGQGTKAVFDFDAVIIRHPVVLNY